MDQERTPARRRRRKWVIALASVALLAALVLPFSAWLLLRGSLPRVDGRLELPGLGRTVEVERDRDGVATIRGASRADLCRATGFVHAQERFFQMDLMRRRAAGELAELLGPAALPADRRARRHAFREVARRVVNAAAPRERQLLAAYVEGVNAGLADLSVRPFEYLLLRTAPRPWAEEDTVLVVLSMFQQLQPGGRLERSRMVLHQALPPAVADFLDPPGSEWDTPLDESPSPPLRLPVAEVLDLRSEADAVPEEVAPAEEVPGSNSWAISAAHGQGGRSLLANDMHLPLTVPGVWYRLRLIVEPESREPRLDAVGVTLPGTPALVVGSNGLIAWGFTNSGADVSDLILLETRAGKRNEAEEYLTPAGWLPLVRGEQALHARGAAPERLTTLRTIWGPVVGRDPAGRLEALRWTAHESEALSFSLFDLERAKTVPEAIRIAHRMGIPPQNIVVADSEGRVGWTIAGRLPLRVGFSGRVPTSWSDGSRRWDGLLPPEEVPEIVDPPRGRVWTANARVVGGEPLALIGDGGYALGARGRQIRDDLLAQDVFDESAMMKIALDDRAIFLQRWRALLLDILDAAAIGAKPARRGLRDTVSGWSGRAEPGDAGYRAVRGFRVFVRAAALAPFIERCRKLDAGFDGRWLLQFEGPLWQLVTRRPPHLLDPKYGSWDELLLDAADQLAAAAERGGGWQAFTWGARAPVEVRHPLSRALPILSGWLDMPTRPLPGDRHMPRVQGRTFGASERMVVSPGHEERGLMQLPAGATGHPLSPYYGAGHTDWEEGRPSPLLPAEAAYRLVLEPRR